MTTNTHPAPAWDEEAVTEAVARALFQRTYPGSTAWDNLPVDEFGKEVWRESAKGLLAVVREHLPVKPDRETIARAIYAQEAQPIYDEVSERMVGFRPWEWITEEHRDHYLSRADEIINLWPGESCATVQAEALRDAADWLAHEYGNDGFPGPELRARADRLAAEGGDDRG